MSGESNHTHCPNFLDMLTLEPGRRKTAEDRNSKDKPSTNTKYQYNSNTNTEVQRVGGHPQMGSSAYGLERNIGGKISTKTNIQIQKYKFEEKDGGHPQLGASANGLDAGGGSNPPVMNILYLLVNSAYNQTEE